MAESRQKFIIMAVWAVILGVCLYVYLFHYDLLKSQFLHLSGSSLFIAYALYLIAGSLRGFTLIPVTYFILAGLILLPPLPLYLLTIAGVIFSSVSVYYFSEYLNFDAYFEKKYKNQIERLKDFLSKNEFPIVAVWSFTPFLPTDLICYVCGTLEVDIKKFLLGVVVGEGLACAIYIFLGKEIITKII